MSNSTNLLTTFNLKHTKARLAALDIFQSEHTPLDAARLQNLLLQKGIEVDQATIYRMLDIYYQKGVIRRFEFQEGKFRYELAGYDHHHLICESCGVIEDIADCAISELENDILIKKGFKVKRHALEFYGICKSCLS